MGNLNGRKQEAQDYNCGLNTNAPQSICPTCFLFLQCRGKAICPLDAWARLEEAQVGHCFTRDDHLGPSIEEREEVIHILWSHVRSESKRVFLLAEGD